MADRREPRRPGQTRGAQEGASCGGSSLPPTDCMEQIPVA
ncbi:hypothetical protein FRUB_09919 [Fimbriiglobus ruber]|uniref:Uncharacterized protein n=1 Tax=Fimbriiglobus ruber TaxID=1908690 RepID=A0A225DG56_9BACT|nr:hypothetical protein FRUB_09919 [Fimbriiglobus ruber]